MNTRSPSPFRRIRHRRYKHTPGERWGKRIIHGRVYHERLNSPGGWVHFRGEGMRRVMLVTGTEFSNLTAPRSDSPPPTEEELRAAYGLLCACSKKLLA